MVAFQIKTTLNLHNHSPRDACLRQTPWSVQLAGDFGEWHCWTLLTMEQLPEAVFVTMPTGT